MTMINFIKLITPVLLAVSLSACRMGGVELAGAIHHPVKLLTDQITLLNWNAHKGADEQMPVDLKHALDHHQPDLIFLQEATGKLSRTSPLQGVFARSWKYPWFKGETVGVLTASSVTPVATVPLPTLHRELGFTAPKMSLATRYVLEDGRDLLALNVHCLNFERWGTRQLKSQLEGLAAVMRQHKGPILLAGDFNTWNHKRYNLVSSFVRDHHLEEVRLNGTVKTGDQGTPWINRMLGIDPALALDRIFYRGLTLEQSEVLDYDSSDHSAVLAKFVI